MVVSSVFLKGRFSDIGDNKKGLLEEGMTKQKSEEIAFKWAKTAEKLSGRTACAKTVGQQGVQLNEGQCDWNAERVGGCYMRWRKLEPGHSWLLGPVRHFGMIPRAIENIKGDGMIKVYVLENHSGSIVKYRSEKQKGGIEIH